MLPLFFGCPNGTASWGGRHSLHGQLSATGFQILPPESESARKVSDFSGQGVGVKGKDVVWLDGKKTEGRTVLALHLLDFAGNERIVH